jgi:hypothetical protein
MSHFSKRALRWAAPVTLVGALGLAACGNSDDAEAVRVAAPSAAGLGSDQHLNNQAEEIARASAGVGSDQHLNNQAAEIASQRANAFEASNRAVQMTQAPAYVWQLQDRAVSSSRDRAVQMTQAPAYVWQLQDRAVSSSRDRAVEMTQAPAYVWQLQDRAVSSSRDRAVEMTQAPAYVWQLQDRAVSSSSGNDSQGDDFLPGSRHVPVR